jgi:hypothetical protein
VHTLGVARETGSPKTHRPDGSLARIADLGKDIGVATNVEIQRALAAVTATLNDQRLEQFDAARVQEIVTESLGGEPGLTVDDGGGLHDESGARIGAIRRTDSVEWITERQNDAAERSDTAIPGKQG